ncbi:hypothetical protein [Alkalicoccobacillus gibsonii]|uniref:hypothetical protein n=1 Tax=Alkalicoccobacillus gibsonii TaxID=79881 RepID=UPI001AED2F1B|nr:hypothetical protein [Alkalicoccobacillus gibsonii]
MVHSWWLSLSLVPFGLTSFLAFFYVGFMARRFRWKVYGVLYTSILFLFFFAPTSGTWSMVLLISWVISIVHLFVIRAPFLEALERTNRKKRKRTIKNSKPVNKWKKRTVRPPIKPKIEVKPEVSIQPEVAIKPLTIERNDTKSPVFKRDLREQATTPKKNIFNTKEKRLRKELHVHILTHSSSLRLIKKVFDQTGTLNHMILVSLKEKLIRTLRTTDEFNQFSDRELNPS